MHFDERWNSAAADSFRAKHEDLDGEVFRTVWDAAQEGWCDGCSPDNCCGCGPNQEREKK